MRLIARRTPCALACASIWLKSFGPNQLITACTRLETPALPRLGSSNSVTSPAVPSIDAMLPPADCPNAAILSGFRLYLAAFGAQETHGSLGVEDRGGERRLA